MIFAANGISITQKEAALRANTTKTTGTLPRMLVKTIRAEGLRVQVAEKRTIADVKKALAQDKIVVVLFIEPVEEWDHYAILREIKDDLVILQDPDARRGTTEMVTKEFLRRWKDNNVGRSRRWAAVVG